MGGKRKWNWHVCLVLDEKSLVGIGKSEPQAWIYDLASDRDTDVSLFTRCGEITFDLNKHFTVFLRIGRIKHFDCILVVLHRYLGKLSHIVIIVITEERIKLILNLGWSLRVKNSCGMGESNVKGFPSGCKLHWSVHIADLCLNLVGDLFMIMVINVEEPLHTSSIQQLFF